MNRVETKIEDLIPKGIYFLQCEDEKEEEGWIFEFKKIEMESNFLRVFDKRCVLLNRQGILIESYQENNSLTEVNACKIYEPTEKDIEIFEGVFFYE